MSIPGLMHAKHTTTLRGLPVYEVPVVVKPKMQLSEAVPVSDRMREEMNAWMVEFFGLVDCTSLKKGEAFVCGGTYFIRSDDLAEMRAKLETSAFPHTIL